MNVLKHFLPLVMLVTLVACDSLKKEQESKPMTMVQFYDTELFHDVQTHQIYPDGKTFVDCEPVQDLASIVSLYNQQKTEDGFDLHAFTHQYFKEPEKFAATFESNQAENSMEHHIVKLWPILTRQPDVDKANSSLIALPHKYVVPGGRFREIYYWDSYFTLEGLLQSNQRDLALSMVQNFAYLIDTIGFIPNGNRKYYLTRSQPPFFSLMVNAIAKSDQELLITYLPQLEKEYNYWMSGERLVKVGDYQLTRYFDTGTTPRPESYREDYELAESLPNTDEKVKLYKNLRAGAASGWDYSSRWFGDGKNLSTIQTIDIVPVDLNCLIYFLENTIAKAYALQNNEEKQVEYSDLALKRKEAIRNVFWNKDEGFFEDYNLANNQLTGQKTLAGMFPLFMSVATKLQAKQVERIINNQFLKPGGFVTSLTHTGQQWDAPNGWAPLQWVTVNGLLNYGYKETAQKGSENWLNINRKVYNDTGKMMEKYNVEDLQIKAGGGEYPNQDGFGWTNGIAIALQELEALQ